MFYLVNKVFDSVSPNDIKVIPAVLVVPNCNAYNELKEMKSGAGGRPKLKSLSLALGIRYFTLKILVDESIL